jgi:hypothetical protein
MSVMGAFSRSQIGEGGAENNRFASKAPNALTFFLSDGFIEKVRLLVRPPLISQLYSRTNQNSLDQLGGQLGVFVLLSSLRMAFSASAGSR